jgi:hypothetical protein
MNAAPLAVHGINILNDNGKGRSVKGRALLFVFLGVPMRSPEPRATEGRAPGNTAQRASWRGALRRDRRRCPSG